MELVDVLRSLVALHGRDQPGQRPADLVGPRCAPPLAVALAARSRGALSSLMADVLRDVGLVLFRRQGLQPAIRTVDRCAPGPDRRGAHAGCGMVGGGSLLLCR